MKRYRRNLKVATPEGEKLYALITPVGDTVHIEVRPLEAVQKDNPPFAIGGVIRFYAPRPKYKEVLTGLTSYLESLMLKELDKEIEVDESIHTSLGVDPKRGRDKKAPKTRDSTKLIRERDIDGLHNSTRGNEQTEGVGRREQGADVAQGSDTEVSTDD